MIFARYGRSAIRLRQLKHVTTAVLLAYSPSVTLGETHGFAGWFARVSPLEEISGLRADNAPDQRESDDRLPLLTVSGVAAGLPNTG